MIASPCHGLGIALVLASALGQEDAALPEAFAEDFAVFWSEVDEWYAYFEEEETDWPAVRALYAPRARAAPDVDAFIGVLERALAELHDHHAHLGANTSESPPLVPSGCDLWAEWRAGEAVVTAVRRGSEAEARGVVSGTVVLAIDGEPVEEAVPGETDRARSFALRVRLAGRRGAGRELTVRTSAGTRTLALGPVAHPQADGLLHQRALEGDIGYIRIHDQLGNFDLVEAFDASLAALRSTKGLILDLRSTPGGGNTLVARGILGRFVDSELPYQRHVLVREARRFGVPRSWTEHVSPRGPFTYRAPVVVLVGRWTGSMGEGLAIGFDGTGRGTVVGGPMAGLRGALREFRLPRTGLVVRIPAERLTHVYGTPREHFEPALVESEPGSDAVLDHAASLLRLAMREGTLDNGR